MTYKTILKPAAFLAVCGFIALSGCNSGMSSRSADISSTIDSVSYSLGYQQGQFLRERGMDDLNLDALTAGIDEALNEKDSKISDTDMQKLVQAYQIKAQQKAQKNREAKATENEAKGEKFLAENKTKEGVKVTDSGLQYKVLKEGTGKSPDADDTVTVNYEGTLIDGTVFDSSYKRGEPATFPLNQVIKGWTEGVQLMKEGATYKFFIPANLAYGNNPRPGGPIGPGETLIFKVELLKVK